MNEISPVGSNHGTNNRLAILDPLRFFAAMAVLFYHYSIFLTNSAYSGIKDVFGFGYLGVEFFFMLSGFVITASAHNRNAFEFALSRVARLYPAFWGALIVTSLVVFFLSVKGIPLKELLINATMLNDYLKIPNVDGVYWTLQAEIKFYGCVFVLLLFGLFQYIRTWVTIWLLLSIGHHFIGQPFFLGWFINPNYSFYFIGGVSSYLLYRNNKDRYALGLLLTAFLFSVIKAGEQIKDFCVSCQYPSQYVAALTILVFFGFFTLLSLGHFKIKANRFYMVLGAISYPLYLIHNRAGKTLVDLLSQKMPIELAILCVIFIVLTLSLAIHFLIEKWLSRTITLSGQQWLKTWLYKTSA